jgi:hypothetical protein
MTPFSAEALAFAPKLKIERAREAPPSERGFFFAGRSARHRAAFVRHRIIQPAFSMAVALKSAAGTSGFYW